MPKLAIIAAAILALLFSSVDSFAMGKAKHSGKREHGKHVHHGKKHAKKHAKHARKAHRRAVREYNYRGGGPPPWAPAHGYRHGRKHGHGGTYVVPFGIATGTCNRTALGAALGATGGGLLGSELSGGDSRAIFGGILAGALLGGALGDAASGGDRDCFGQTLEHAPSNEPVVWRDPDAGTAYQVTPTRTYEVDGGQYCREYTTRVTIGGREESAVGTACRQPDGSWEESR